MASNAAAPALKVCSRWNHPVHNKSSSAILKIHSLNQFKGLSLSSRAVSVPRALKDTPMLERSSEEEKEKSSCKQGTLETGVDSVKASSTSTVQVEEHEEVDMKRVCDKLIDVFTVDRPDPEDWRKLLAFSQEWKRIRSHFFKQCQVRAETEEDPKTMGKLYKLSRKLKEIDEEMMRHDELLKEVEENEGELDVLVAKRRKDFTGDFFKHVHVLCNVNHSDLVRREKLVQIATRSLTAVEEYDKLAGDNFALEAARQKFDDIINSPTLGDACKKIDRLVRNKQFDPTLMLLISKAWASAKESPMMKEEVKDIMFHLYNVAKGNMQRLVPKEVRILKHLLTVEDPRERQEALAQAFAPGQELEGKDVDLLYTTPQKLYSQVLFILDAYYNKKESTLIQEAQKLMDPLVISRLETLRDAIKQEFL